MGFDAYWRGAYDFGAFAPHWFLVALVGTIAALSWLRCRFSLRAVLFATTLVAVVLGLIVYAVRK